MRRILQFILFAIYPFTKAGHWPPAPKMPLKLFLRSFDRGLGAAIAVAGGRAHLEKFDISESRPGRRRGAGTEKPGAIDLVVNSGTWPAGDLQIMEPSWASYRGQLQRRFDKERELLPCPTSARKTGRVINIGGRTLA